MKKLFTLALALLVATVGFSQVRQQMPSKRDAVSATKHVTKGMESFENVQNQPNMTRTDGELDYTTYDWQSNAGNLTRTIVWPDGKINFAYTIASDASFSDRGTGIGTYDSEKDEWTPLGGRIENERTGFGSIARYKENGIVVAAHTNNNLAIYIAEDKDNMEPNSVSAALYVGSADYTHPAVMTSGPNRDIIHMIACKFQGYEGNVYEPLRYWRSSDGGQTWDKEYVELPFLTAEYGINWGSNSYYFMETSDNNRIGLVINNSWSDGMVLYSDDNGETWERKVFYHHPDPFGTYPSEGWGFGYPRCTSMQWGVDGELCMAYEWNGSNDVATSTSGGYFPGMGGVAFWSESLPYSGENGPVNGCDPNNPMPPTYGQPFILDSAYIYEDLYASWWLWSDANHEMFPEYMGYLSPIDPETLQPLEDPYTATEWNIETYTNHGSYNGGVCAFPVLALVPGCNGFDMVAVWSAMDELHKDGDLHYYKLFASYSGDGGKTWARQKQLTTDFMYEISECIYAQAAVMGTTLVVAVQMDQNADSFVQGTDTDPDNNYYQGLTFELNDLFPNAGVGVEETVSHNTHMTLYPNPATDRLNITLSQNAEIVVYNMTGQKVLSQEGHAGANVLNISNLTSGVYFVNAGTDTQKFIVK
ncbi:MAG: T9SS type A sorting domain-containing protein [Bacteroidales bacterium]|nr:T9SS type A sorting domain-containing protein [Bacteroidales bacterium]